MENLTSSRLKLRPLIITDVDPIFAMRSNAYNNQYLDRVLCQTKDDTSAFIKSILSKTENSALKYWVITLINTDSVIGTICVYNHDQNNQSCEIGFELLHDFQGNGYIMESVKAVLGFATTVQEIKTVHAYTHELNTRSINVLEKCGFSQTTTERPVDEDLLQFSINLPL
jgi:[ribosomal protein S5]-alanine N-acetyltransferase